MESSPGFDLNEAIRRWRERLMGLMAFGADDLDELENHLREAVTELQSGGLSSEEALLVATERLGSEHRLAREYSKTNARRVWTGRGAWLLGGVMAERVMEALDTAAFTIAQNVSLWLGMNAHLAAALGILSGWAVAAAWIVLVGWLASGRHHRLTGAVGRCFRRPIWTGGALVLGLMGLQVMSYLPAFWWGHHPPAARAATSHADLHTWYFAAGLFHRLLWVVAIPLLAAWLAKLRRAVDVPPVAIPIGELLPGERVLAGQLAAQGLSPAESQLVIARRRGYPATSGQPHPRLDLGRWLERGLWMTVGVVAYWMWRDFLYWSAWILLIRPDFSSPLSQHLGGFLAMFLPPTLMGLAVAAFWKAATGGLRRHAWVRRVFERGPFGGAILFTGLAVLWVGLNAYHSLAQPLNSALPIQSYGRIELFWILWRDGLINYLLPAVLMAWVGKRYYKQARHIPSEGISC